MLLLVEQILNGLQFGLLLFLLAAGLTLVFGIMDLVNLAHGSLYMMGAYFAATFVAWTGSFVLGAVLALGATLLLGMVLEFTTLRHLYGRDHLDHVLATFGLILFFNEAVRLIWGPAGLALPLPPWLSVPVEILPGVYYPAYRLAIIVVALLVALLLFFVGGAFSVYEGFNRLIAREPLQHVYIALLVLGISVVLEALSLMGALREIRARTPTKSLWRWFRETRESDLLVVAGEDIAALAGLAIAFAAPERLVATLPALGAAFLRPLRRGGPGRPGAFAFGAAFAAFAGIRLASRAGRALRLQFLGWRRRDVRAILL